VFYATDGHGGYNLLREFDDWRTTWTAIVAGVFCSKPGDAIFADLFFYEGSTGYGETYATNGKGGITMLDGQGGFPPATDVLGGNFGCMGNLQEYTNLLFFNRPTNVGTIFAISVYSANSQDPPSWKPVETLRPASLDPISSAKPMLERSIVVGPIIPLRPWGMVSTGNFCVGAKCSARRRNPVSHQQPGRRVSDRRLPAGHRSRVHGQCSRQPRAPASLRDQPEGVRGRGAVAGRRRLDDSVHLAQRALPGACSDG
jgi:hypothetical protein